MKFRHSNFYKYLFSLVLLSCLFSENLAYAQHESLVAKANELIFSNPDEAIKIGEHLLKNAKSETETAAFNLLLSRSSRTKGDYNNSIIFVFEAGKQAPSVDYSLKIEINLLKAALLRILYLDSHSKKYLEEANKMIPHLASDDEQKSMKFFIDLEQISMNLDRHENQQALELIAQVEKHKELFKKEPILRQQFEVVKGKAFGHLQRYDSAHYYFDKTLRFSELKSKDNFFEKAVIHLERGYVLLQQKKYEEAEKAFLAGSVFAEKLGNISLKKQINRGLAIKYLAVNDKSKHTEFNNKFLVLNNNLDQLEQEAVNTAYNLISQEEEANFWLEEKKYSTYFYVSIALFLVITLLGVIFWLKGKWKKKRLREIINYLEISRNIFSRQVPIKKENSKKILIPIETEQNILSKLKRFENSTKFTNKEMSLAVLAGQFETNTKYLSEIINKHYNDNFNTYINKLRINFIIEKLKSDSNFMHYKISFLAERSGFSSHSSFATVFKSITGITPATFIDLLKEETERKNEEVN